MLFENKERTTTDPKSRVESDWEYLDHSGRAEAENVRNFLNFWFGQYPELEQSELASRFRSNHPHSFQSAAFELTLFAILRSLGCEIEIHPELPNGSTTHPDFLVTTPQSEKLYVEAVLASEYSETQLAAERRLSVVLETIERVESPDYFISVDPEGVLEHPPNGRNIRRALNRWISSLSYDQVIANIDERGLSALPTTTWIDDGWSIRFEAIPKKPDRRGLDQRSIGAEFSQTGWVNAWEPIRDALKAKGSRYGEPIYPLLIAVNIEAMTVTRIDEMQALFGQETFTFNQNENHSEPDMQRRPNGAWHGPRGPQYTRVSGAWIFRNINPWNIVSRISNVYFNPFASREIPGIFRVLPHAETETDTMRWRDGASLSDLLGLHQHWPESAD